MRQVTRSKPASGQVFSSCSGEADALAPVSVDKRPGCLHHLRRQVGGRDLCARPREREGRMPAPCGNVEHPSPPQRAERGCGKPHHLLEFGALRVARIRYVGAGGAAELRLHPAIGLILSHGQSLTLC